MNTIPCVVWLRLTLKADLHFERVLRHIVNQELTGSAENHFLPSKSLHRWKLSSDLEVAKEQGKNFDDWKALEMTRLLGSSEFSCEPIPLRK